MHRIWNRAIAPAAQNHSLLIRFGPATRTTTTSTTIHATSINTLYSSLVNRLRKFVMLLLMLLLLFGWTLHCMSLLYKQPSLHRYNDEDKHFPHRIKLSFPILFRPQNAQPMFNGNDSIDVWFRSSTFSLHCVRKLHRKIEYKKSRERERWGKRKENTEDERN